MKESVIPPKQIPSPEGSAFLAGMRSHKKIFNRLATFGQKLRDNENVLGENKNIFQEPRDRSRHEPDGPEKLSQNNKISQHESHIQDHLDNHKTPHLSILGDPSTCKECNQSGEEHPRSTLPGGRFDDCNSLSATPKISNLSKSSKTSKEVKIQEILPSEADSNRGSRSWPEVPKDADSNGESWSWTDIVKNFRSENSRGGRNQSSTD